MNKERERESKKIFKKIERLKNSLNFHLGAILQQTFHMWFITGCKCFTFYSLSRTFQSIKVLWEISKKCIRKEVNKAITTPRIQNRDSHKPESLYDICGNKLRWKATPRVLHLMQLLSIVEIDSCKKQLSISTIY